MSRSDCIASSNNGKIQAVGLFPLLKPIGFHKKNKNWLKLNTLELNGYCAFKLKELTVSISLTRRSNILKDQLK